MAIRRVPDSLQSSGAALPPAAMSAASPVKPSASQPLKKSANPLKADAKPEPVAAPVAAPTPKTRKRTSTAKKAQAVLGATAAPAVSEDVRRGMIALSAYLRGEKRGFAPGGEREDWVAAEKEVDALLSSGHGATQ